ncbi:cell adhesion molecule 3 isoform X2 [Lepisosteus oculatus]|uniref:cell adhesion molecule 3 isoform X2 n=1 Tax=Lepisosteus oculatus TaxID=7918 RepID=UPI00372019D4
METDERAFALLVYISICLFLGGVEEEGGSRPAEATQRPLSPRGSPALGPGVRGGGGGGVSPRGEAAVGAKTRGGRARDAERRAMAALRWAALAYCSSLAVLLASGNFVLDVEDQFQPVTSDETVAVGGTVTLTCRVQDNDNSSLQWSNTAQQTLYFGEKRALRDHRIQLVQSTPTELSISIANVNLSDEGEYTCSIFTMPVRTAKATVTVLGVPQRPVIKGYPGPIVEGGTLELSCHSSGSKPPARLRWFKGAEQIPGRPDVVDPEGKTFTVMSSINYTVSREDNDAIISCSVGHESLQTSDKSMEQRIQVLYKPSVRIQPESDLPREGEKFFLQCVGLGNPEPSVFKWERKEGELPLLSKQDGSYLYFELLNKSDNGLYHCEADNGIGKGEAEYQLSVLDADAEDPPDPTAMSTSSGIDHAVIGGVVAVIVFILLCLLIVLGRYLIRHKGTYLTHEAKGSDDAPDADTAIINAEGGQSGAEDKKEYFI